MRVSFGKFVEAERKKKGFDQAQLAQRLGNRVGQQAISRWERGRSRPRRDMVRDLAVVLGVEEKLLLELGEYDATDSNEEVSRGGQPTINHLPFEDLRPDQFEEFCCELLSMLYIGKDVHRLGSQGHKQFGFDILVQVGSKIVVGAQVKREKTFGPRHMQKAVQAAMLKSPKKLVLLSRIASSGARLERNKHNGWDIWDQDDLSRKVKQLPKDKALRLVDSFFPTWRWPFLGIREPSPWRTKSEYFAPFISELYHHRWALVGRSEVLSQIQEFLTSSNPVGVLVGRGGIGKTRLISSIVDLIETSGKSHTYILGSDPDIRPEDYEHLPRDSDLLVIFDDAHDRQHVAQIVAGVRRWNTSARFIFATRPYGEYQLDSELRQLGLYGGDLPRWTIEDLSIDDAESLVGEILGQEADRRVVSKVAMLGRDCPLVAVVGATLIANGRIDPYHLENEGELHRAILDKFEEHFETEARAADPKVVRSLIRAIALIQPVRMADKSFIEALEKVVGVPYRDFVSALTHLERSGVLLNRGDTIRIVPDLLGDVVLRRASFDEIRKQTVGFLEAVWQDLGPGPLQHAFINTCRLDWMLRKEGGMKGSMTDQLWAVLAISVLNAGIRGRLNLLELLRRVALFDPERSLALVVDILNNPTASVEDSDEPLAKLYPPTQSQIMEAAARVLRVIGHNFRFIDQAANILWALGKLDARRLNTFYDHPIRILQDFANYDHGKPLAYSEAVVNAAERWLKEDLTGNAHSPLDVIEGLFATEGHSDSQVGHSLRFEAFGIRPSVVRELRHRCAKIAVVEAKSPDLGRAVRAVQFLSRGLHYPAGLLGRQISAEEREAWDPEVLYVMDRLHELATTVGTDPCLSIAIRRAIAWHVRHPEQPSGKTAVEILAGFQTDIQHELTLALHDGWAHFRFSHLEERSDIEAMRQNWLQLTARKANETYSAVELAAEIEGRLDKHREAFGDSGSPGPFIATLAKHEPKVVWAVIDRIIANPGSSLVQVLPDVLARGFEENSEQALSKSVELVSLNVLPVTQCVSHALGWNRVHRPIAEGEFALLERLAKHEDQSVRMSMVGCAQSIAPIDILATTRILSLIRINDSEHLAEAVVSAMRPSGGIDWNLLPGEVQDHIWNGLKLCPNLEQWQLAHFFMQASETKPEKVVRFFMDRIEFYEALESETSRRFQPMPYERLVFTVSEGNLRRKLMVGVMDWIEEKPDSWKRYHFGAQLFKALARGYDEEVIRILDQEAWSKKSERLVVIGQVIAEAPVRVVWEHPDFISHLLTAARAFGEETLKHVQGELYSCAVSGMRSTVAGQPFPEDIEQRDRSSELAQRFEPGSPERQFYEMLRDSAIQHLKVQQIGDEKMADHREW